MCGIVGWVDSDSRTEGKASILDRMAETLRHRGPDDYQTWIHESAAFGHQRLIVVDPDGGRQPMVRTARDEQFVLCYNGELYNTEDIRSVLKSKGWSFASHSDTEVLLISYIEWGPDCVDHLNGIFAFSVWETKRKRLFLARDRLGVKPLFYSHQGDRLLYASEMKAILAHPDVDPVVDRSGVHELLSLGPSRTPGQGVFKDIQEIRPGHCALFEKGKLSVKRYWNVKSAPHEHTFDETVDKVRELFMDASTRQLVSDVKLGTFLSGGVDSSAITAVAAEMYKQNQRGTLETFSIDYKDQARFFKKNAFQPDRDEAFIQLVSQQHQTDHTVMEAATEDLMDRLKQAVELRDLPGMADVDSSLLWFCEEIKKHVTVALSGECADEIFGGYPWFYRKEDKERKGFPWIRSLNERNQLVRDDLKGDIDVEWYMLKRYNETIAETPLLDGEGEDAQKHRQMSYLNMNWFMQTLLERKDRMSMGASLEVRVPFSDHRLVEYVWNVPWSMKFHNDQEKGLLRQALRGILPDRVLFRKKNPYPKTFHPDYTRAVCKWMDDILSDERAPLFQLFDRDQVRKLKESEGKSIDTPWFGQLMTGPQLIAHLCQIDHWFRTYRVQL
ncbi:asparagine synthase (glutamine-hydrolyzing) [Halobacillus litoralis]|uniref:asparagine synthase (glutamine-hydrolyzing) n=1 Tax=Halobacillus litoralis TaxID=45668 RepID=A0A845DY90_9BACI|nr:MULTISPECIES: asparagine synthase (glutamine-hydrolyzing) [Halobacillus]MYL18424.1 asparagine synthase (glutamine-hydrolyzing) [Halobacillus litoralis]MYL30569.1 asparagine synthase (glutamine-hydrolyzing) [Halobacillus halophilus]MYL38586.1 asparagine synthase (glutamine-hydrolyzing) [Halobacillus litoralis]